MDINVGAVEWLPCDTMEDILEEVDVLDFQEHASELVQQEGLKELYV